MNGEFNDDLKDGVDYCNRQIHSWSEEQLKNYKDSIELFKKHCKDLEIDIDDSNIEFVPTIGVIATSPGLVAQLVTGINKDKEGLYNCRNLYDLFPKKNRIPGYICVKEYLLMFNPRFRREMDCKANWAPQFVDLFWGVDDSKIDSYISLDCDRVRINTDDYSYCEADTWFGSPYKGDISQISDGSANLRPPTDLAENIISYLFKDVYALDIYWSTKGGIKTFQALEFKNDNIKIILNNSEYHPARYIHAEYDIKNDLFRHFDGAIQYYSSSEYFARRGSDFRHNIKEKLKIKAISEKLFKFNGEISVDMWSGFCCHFFAGNPLTFEYFTGNYPEHTEDALKSLRESFSI